MNKLSNLPPKGTADWLPHEFLIRKYIFDTWRQVCLAFGYEEYLTPIIESAEVFRAKSGEDVGGKELMTMTDRAGRELAIRPEMTPSVTRMVSRIYDNSIKPIRLFSIANFMRNEKPQKGRNREFWQLNCDIFGSNSANADIEILQLVLELMKKFGATKEQFVVYINDRQLIETLMINYLKIPQEKIQFATRILDKFGKLNNDDLVRRLIEEAKATIENTEELIGFLSQDEKALTSVKNKYLLQDLSFQRLTQIINALVNLGYEGYCIYNPSMVRGFDYYDGIIFEVFDRKDFLKNTNKDTNSYRSLFGGGRYNGLAAVFGGQSFPAVGFAPGDETTKIFLEDHNLINKLKLKTIYYYLPILNLDFKQEIFKLASLLRISGKNIITGLEEQKMKKALDYANKKEIDYVVIFGEEEKGKGIYTLKDMKSGEQSEIKLQLN